MATVTVRVNSSHDGMRAGQEYELQDTKDVRARIEAGRLTLIKRNRPPAKKKAEETAPEEATESG